MSLNETLQQMRAAALGRIPPEKAAIMTKTTAELAKSGIAEKALSRGDQAPEFVLEDFNGQEHVSRELLSNGPLVLSFYRGSW